MSTQPIGAKERCYLPETIQVAGGTFVKITPPATAYALPLRIEGKKAQSFSLLLPCRHLKQIVLKLHAPALLRVGSGARIEPMNFAAGCGQSFFAHLLGAPVLRVAQAGATLILQSESRSQRNALRKDLKILNLFGLGAHTAYREADAGLVLGFSVASPRPSAHRKPSLALGVVAHLHFRDVWADIEASLRCIPDPFGLIVTLTAADPELERRINASFPGADIRLVPNVGRDIRPFIELLDEGALDGFDLVCKIHGKKSLRDGLPTALGDLWRRSALYDLISGPGRLDEVLKRFDSDAGLGLLGPERFRVPNERFSAHDAWSGNRTETLALAERLALLSQFKLDFFAGTMFWVRPAALKSLRGAGLGAPDAYAPEAGSLDCSMEHALERLFTTSAIAGGFSLGALPPLPDARS